MYKWSKRNIKLRFNLGDLVIFKKQLHFIVNDTHFTELTTNLAQEEISFNQLSSQVQGILIRSHPIEKELPRLIFSNKLIRYIPWQYNRYFIRFNGKFSDYLQKFSSKSRWSLKRKIRKFKEFSGGKLIFREYRSVEEIRNFYTLAREISKKTYQEKLYGKGLPKTKKFQANIQAKAQEGTIIAYLLFVENKPVAYLCLPIKRNVVFCEYMGYNPDYSFRSPGNVILFLALQRLFEEKKYDIFDFTEGYADFKSFFATESQLCADVYYFRFTLSNFSLILLHSGFYYLSQILGKLSNTLKIKERIKKIIRFKR